MSNSKDKSWNEKILVDGGVSYYTPNDSSKKYRVSLTSKKVFGVNEGNSVKLKYKIKTASGEMFSVQAKTLSEAEVVVGELFGKGKYNISTMML